MIHVAKSTLPLDPSWTHQWDRGRGRKEIEKKEKSFRERSSIFSLNFPAIGPTISSEVRGKVHPRDKNFSSRPESGSFDKLQEVGVFFYLVQSLSKNGQMVGVFGVGMAVHFSPKELGLSAEISRTVFRQSELDLWIVMDNSEMNC